MEIHVTIDDSRLQAALQRYPERVEAAVEAALARGAEEMARSARRHAPKAFSTLTNSIRAARVGTLHYRVAPGVGYAAFVERGRRPGRQPGTANGLMEWVRQKTGLAGAKLDQRTFLIARAIGRKGIRPQPFMRPAAEETESRLRAMVKGAVSRSLAEVFGA